MWAAKLWLEFSDSELWFLAKSVEQCVQGAKHANAQNEYSTGERLSLREKKSLKEYGY